MSKKTILFFILSVATFFVAMEFYLRPPNIKKVEPDPNLSATISNSSSNQNNLVEAEKKIDVIEMHNISKDKFNLAGIADVSFVSVAKTNSLFRRITLDPKKLGYSIVTAIFNKEAKPFVKVYEFQPEKKLTTTKIYNSLLILLQESIKEEEKETINVNQVDSFGDHSFYFNNKTNYPGMVFVVIRKDKKILAFEYKEESHEDMQKLFRIIFGEKEINSNSVSVSPESDKESTAEEIVSEENIEAEETAPEVIKEAE